MIICSPNFINRNPCLYLTNIGLLISAFLLNLTHQTLFRIDLHHYDTQKISETTLNLLYLPFIRKVSYFYHIKKPRMFFYYSK